VGQSSTPIYTIPVLRGISFLTLASRSRSASS
jgi:hypothetical protein